MTQDMLSLGFDHIIEQLQEMAVSQSARRILGNTEPILNESLCRARMEETTAARRVMENTGAPPLTETENHTNRPGFGAAGRHAFAGGSLFRRALLRSHPAPAPLSAGSRPFQRRHLLLAYGAAGAGSPGGGYQPFRPGGCRAGRRLPGPAEPAPPAGAYRAGNP